MNLDFRSAIQTCILLVMGLSHAQAPAQILGDAEATYLKIYRMDDCAALREASLGLDETFRQENKLRPTPTGHARADRHLPGANAEWDRIQLARRAALAQVIREKQCENPQAAALPAVNARQANPAQVPVTPSAAGLLSQIGARVDVVSPAFAQSLGLKQAGGALVLDTDAGSPAQKAGLQALDVIVEITGQQVQSPADLQESLGRMRPGFKAPLRVWRNKAMRDVVVDIGETPVRVAEPAPVRSAVTPVATAQPSDDALQRKAESGDVPSMLQLALKLEAAPATRPQATAWYRKAADAGSPAGLGGVGASYFNATDRSKDEVLAEQWWRKGAALGDGRSMTGLSLLYAEGKGGMPLSLQLSQEWLFKAVATGNGRAMYRLSTQYATGGSGLPRDDAQALGWMEKAAATGEPLIMATFAELYENGRGGVPQNDVLALSWAQKAAALGEPRSMNRIGFFYRAGRGGLPQSNVQALAWYQKAAALGDEPGMLNLGNFYLQGLVVPQNDVAALAWYRKAAALGNAQAEGNIRFLESKGVR